MKRGTRPFIVEVRRGQKRTTPTEGEEDSSPLRNEALRRAEVALFGAPPAEPSEARLEPVSPPPPPRRILASLTEPEPEVPLFAEPERRRGRKPGKVQKTEEPRRNGKSRATDTAARNVPLTPELVSAALDKIEKVTLADPWRPGLQRVSAAADGAEKALRVRRKKTAASSRRADSKLQREPAKAAPVAAPAQSVASAKRMGSRPLQKASADTPSRRPSIRGRYVFGTEPKPGERWKRRLRGRH